MRFRLLLALTLLGVGAGAARAEPEVGAAPPRFVDLAPEGPSVEERLSEIARRVQAAARYPASARLRGVAGEARVAFEVRPDGTPGEVDLVASSGSQVLDRAALRAVRGAGALPRVLGRVNVPVRFALKRVGAALPEAPSDGD